MLIFFLFVAGFSAGTLRYCCNDCDVGDCSGDCCNLSSCDTWGNTLCSSNCGYSSYGCFNISDQRFACEGTSGNSCNFINLGNTSAFSYKPTDSDAPGYDECSDSGCPYYCVWLDQLETPVVVGYDNSGNPIYEKKNITVWKTCYPKTPAGNWTSLTLACDANGTYKDENGNPRYLYNASNMEYCKHFTLILKNYTADNDNYKYYEAEIFVVNSSFGYKPKYLDFSDVEGRDYSNSKVFYIDTAGHYTGSNLKFDPVSRTWGCCRQDQCWNGTACVGEGNMTSSGNYLCVGGEWLTCNSDCDAVKAGGNWYFCLNNRWETAKEAADSCKNACLNISGIWFINTIQDETQSASCCGDDTQENFWNSTAWCSNGKVVWCNLTNLCTQITGTEYRCMYDAGYFFIEGNCTNEGACYGATWSSCKAFEHWFETGLLEEAIWLNYSCKNNFCENTENTTVSCNQFEGWYGYNVTPDRCNDDYLAYRNYKVNVVDAKTFSWSCTYENESFWNPCDNNGTYKDACSNECADAYTLITGKDCYPELRDNGTWKGTCACSDYTSTNCAEKESEESDVGLGEKEYFVAGTVKDYINCTNNACFYFEYADYCKDDLTLVEYHASGTSYTSEEVDCSAFSACWQKPDGTFLYNISSCVNGACVFEPKDPDEAQSYCEACRLNWINDKCCGDDANEVLRSREGEISESSDIACCSSSTDCVLNGICYQQGAKERWDGKEYTCVNGAWSSCAEGDEKPIDSFTFCLNAKLISCNSSNLCKKLETSSSSYICTSQGWEIFEAYPVKAGAKLLCTSSGTLTCGEDYELGESYENFICTQQGWISEASSDQECQALAGLLKGECFTGYFVEGASFNCEFEPKEDGTPCSKGVCINGTCVELKKEGEACSMDEECQLGLACIDGVCQKLANCGNGMCEAGECRRCPKDCLLEDCINDGFCTVQLGENCQNSPDCACLEGQICDPTSIYADAKGCVTPPCGNGKCEPGECSTCPIDCTLKQCIGDGICSPQIGENCDNSKDCVCKVEAMLNPVLLEEGEVREAKLTLKNKGNMPVTVRLSYYTKEGLEVDGDEYIVLDPGEERSIKLKVSAEASGKYEVKVKALSKKGSVLGETEASIYVKPKNPLKKFLEAWESSPFGWILEVYDKVLLVFGLVWGIFQFLVKKPPKPPSPYMAYGYAPYPNYGYGYAYSYGRRGYWRGY